jgi:hypothetical protein
MLDSIENTADRRATDGWDGWDDVADHTQVRKDGLDFPSSERPRLA